MREIILNTPGDFAEWRDAARALLAAEVPPEQVVWRQAGESASLFSDDAPLVPGARLPCPARW